MRIKELAGALSSSVRDHNELIEEYEDLVAGLVGNHIALIDSFTQTSKERDQLKEKVKEIEVGTVKLNAWLESAMRCLYDSSDVLRGKKESLDRTITSVVVEIEQEWVWPK